MNRSTPGLPVHHQLPEFTQTHVHRVSDAIQPSHPLSSPSPPAPNPSLHLYIKWASLVAQLVKKYACNARDQVLSWVGKIPWSRAWQPTPVFFTGEFHGAWQAAVHGVIESDTPEQLSTYEGWVIFEPSDHAGTQNIHEGTLWSQLLLP